MAGDHAHCVRGCLAFGCEWVFQAGGEGSGKQSACQSTREMQIRSLDREDLLEEEMATPSSVLAWKIAWTEEPGRL